MSEMPEPSDDLTGRSVGRFRIRERLGAGGMGEVYLADDSQLRRAVAIKRMSRRFVGDEHHRQRFLREARMASRLNDPHIAAVHDVFEREGEIFLVMERVEGETLRRRLARGLAPGEFLALAGQCARALMVAHAEGVLHRDIKPDNIMVTPAGQVKVLDFGLARGTDGNEETMACATEPGSVSGTAGYIAPEVLVGGEPDARADIFSLGVVFYEALTGSQPFQAKTSFASSNLALNVEPPPPSAVDPAVSPDLDRIVMRMLAKDPAARYQSAGELEADLRLVQQGVALPAVRPAAARRRFTRSRRLLLGLGSATAILAVAWAAGRWWRAPAQPAVAAARPAAARQLAVLPFEALGGTAAQRAFAAGLTDTVTARLTELSATQRLAVVPASLVFSRQVDSADAARRQFGVTLVLTGSLQQAGTEVRVTYALVDARSLRQLSASTKTIEAGNPFALEDDVASGVLEMLQLQLDPGERKKFDEKGTDRPGAYEFYLQGMGYLQNYDRDENITSAISLFEHALEIDPHDAKALAGLGMAYWHRYLLSDDARWTAPSRRACDRALSIDSTLAAAHVCLGTVDNGTGRYAEAAAQFQKALSAQPTSDAAYEGLGDAYEKQGRLSEAEQTYRQAIRLRPQYWAGYSWLGIFYFNQGRYADAAQMFEQVVALAPDSVVGYYDLGGVRVLAGDFAGAVAPLKRSIAIRPSGSAYSNLGTAEFYLHRYADAVADFEQAARVEPKSFIIWRNVGDGYYWGGGSRSRADEAYRKAIALAGDALRVNPKDADAYKVIAVSRAMTGKHAAAIAAMTRTLALAPGDPDAKYTAAIVYTQVGRPQQGLQWLKQALAAGASAAMARNEPAFAALRGLPGFPESLRAR